MSLRQAPTHLSYLCPEADGSSFAAGTVRLLNRKPGFNLPLDGPKTLNGLLLEYLEDIPDAGVNLKIENISIEIVQTQGGAIKIHTYPHFVSDTDNPVIDLNSGSTSDKNHRNSP